MICVCLFAPISAHRLYFSTARVNNEVLVFAQIVGPGPVASFPSTAITKFPLWALLSPLGPHNPALFFWIKPCLLGEEEVCVLGLAPMLLPTGMF